MKLRSVHKRGLARGRSTAEGFTIFFAVLVSSLALAVGLVIYDVTVRQLALATSSLQSQYAIYAADTGAECALYWDTKGLLDTGTYAFATSSASSPKASGVLCNGVDIAAYMADPTNKAYNSDTWTPTTAINTFYVTSTAGPWCAGVQVSKFILNGGVHTTVQAHGYNTCVPGPSQVERVLQVDY